MTVGRVMIVSHGHPDFSIGGAENAAYLQFLEMKARGIDCYFIARVGGATRHSGLAITNRTPDGREILLHCSSIDHFRHSQLDKRLVYDVFRNLLRRLQPAVVHFHHYVHLGIELIREVRHALPKSRIGLTLHEYLAICHAQGQMLRTSGSLCDGASPIACSRCFPSHTPQDFFLRELFLKSFLRLCDFFICPSSFLKRRYADWGLPDAKMVVLENGIDRVHVPKESVRSSDIHSRFLVLGQLSRLKGTLLLLQAAHLISGGLRKRLRIEIHGAMDKNDTVFVTEFERQIGSLRDFVTYAGPYRHADVGLIIRKHGWVIQPSIWWENSPLVIQESFAESRPVICSDIGGMKEKVTDNVDGLHFRVSSASDLARTIELAAMDHELWERLSASIQWPPAIQTTVESLLELYTRPLPAALDD